MDKKMFAKRTLPMALAAVLAISPMQVMAASNDLNGHWAEKVITEWQDKGLIKGYADGSFKPNNNVTRAEFVIMMNNALGFEDAEDISFGDVKPGDWYYNAVAKAVAAGYSKGYEDGTFKPGATITRAEAAVMIANAAGLEADETGVAGFTDAYAIPGWAKGSIGAAVKAGFMSGYTDGSFGATKSITRAEAVSSLNRVMGGAAVEEEVTEEVVAEDVTVTEDDAVVENEVINGDLIIDEKVGDGEVYLNDLVVEGDVIVNGGGDDSIYFKNVTVKGKVKVNKKNVRVQFSGDTRVPQVEVHEVANITSEDFEGEVGTITIVGDLGTGTRVTIDVPADAVVIEGKSSVAINADVTTVEVGEDAEGAKVEVAKNATVDTVVADAKVTIAGTGKVENLEANASGITVNKNLSVDKTETASGVSKPTTSGTTSGGGGGGGNHSSNNNNSGTTTPDTTVTKADVEALITQAQELMKGVETSTDGTDLVDGKKWVTTDVQTALTNAIQDATGLVGAGAVTAPTQEELKAAKAALDTAMANYKPATVDLTQVKADLAAKITEATERNGVVVESTDGTDIETTKEWTNPTAKTGLTGAITTATTEKDNAEATKTSLTTAQTNLEKALADFEAQVAWGTKGAKEILELSTQMEAVTVEGNEELLTAEDVLTKYADKFPTTLEFTFEGAEGDAKATATDVTWTCTNYTTTAGTYTFTASYKIPQGYKDETPVAAVTNTVTLSMEQKATVTKIEAVVVDKKTFELNGDAPVAADFVVTATMSKGEPATKTLDPAEYTVNTDAVKMHEVGTYAVTITLSEDETKTTTVEVEVVNPAAGAKEALDKLAIPTELTVGVAQGEDEETKVKEAILAEIGTVEGYTVSLTEDTYTAKVGETPAKWVGKVTVAEEGNAKNTATSEEAITITITIEKVAAVTAVAVDASLVVEYVAEEDEAADEVTVTLTGTDLTEAVQVALAKTAPTAEDAGEAVDPAEGATTATVELSTAELAVGTYNVYYTVDGKTWTKDDVTVEVRPHAGEIELGEIEITATAEEVANNVASKIETLVKDEILAETAYADFTVTVETAEDGYVAPTAEAEGSWEGTIVIADNKETTGFENNVTFTFATTGENVNAPIVVTLEAETPVKVDATMAEAEGEAVFTAGTADTAEVTFALTNVTGITAGNVTVTVKDGSEAIDGVTATVDTESTTKESIVVDVTATDAVVADVQKTVTYVVTATSAVTVDEATTNTPAELVKEFTVTVNPAVKATVAVDEATTTKIVAKGAEATIAFTTENIADSGKIEYFVSEETLDEFTNVSAEEATVTNNVATVELATTDSAVGTFYVYYKAADAEWSAEQVVEVEVRPAFASLTAEALTSLTEVTVAESATEDDAKAAIVAAVKTALGIGAEDDTITVVAETEADLEYAAPTEGVPFTWKGTIVVTDTKLSETNKVTFFYGETVGEGQVDAGDFISVALADAELGA